MMFGKKLLFRLLEQTYLEYLGSFFAFGTDNAHARMSRAAHTQRCMSMFMLEHGGLDQGGGGGGVL